MCFVAEAVLEGNHRAVGRPVTWAGVAGRRPSGEHSGEPRIPERSDLMSDSGGTGRQAPDFALRTAAGDTVRLSDLRGRHVVLFFIREFT
jgi:hypothetical protein